MVEEEIFWTMSGDPVCPERILRVKRFDWVEVAPMVSIEETSAEDVPTAILSVKVWGRTRVPSSWNPETLDAEMPVHWRLPEESVVRALEPEQVAMVEILRSPPAMTRPELRVEVAVVFDWKIFPPEMVSPEAEESPPLVPIEIPPAKVEVPVPPTSIVEEAWKSP